MNDIRFRGILKYKISLESAFVAAVVMLITARALDFPAAKSS